MNKAKGYDQASKDLDNTFQDMQSHVVALDQVQSVIGKIHQSISPDSILNEILAHLTHLLNCEHGIIVFTSETRNFSRCHTRSDLPHSISCNLASERIDLVPIHEWLDHRTAWIDNEPRSGTCRALEIYGIEDDPKDRVAAGKRETARVELRAFHRGGNIFIAVSYTHLTLPTN